MVIVGLNCEKELIQDLKVYLKYDENESNNFEELYIEYLNFKNKNLLNINNIRNIFISKELKENTKYQEFKNIIENIKNEFEINKIDNIRKRLSSRVKIPSFKDYLLNNWDICHLHLCDDMPDCNDRRNELLFVKFYKNNAYFLDIKDHRSFASRDFIRIIHNNWPEIIIDYKVNGIIDIEPKVEKDEDIFNLWKNGINIFIVVYDENLKQEVFYMPLTLGINMQGYRTQDVMNLISFRKECDNIKDYLNKYAQEIQQSILKIKKIKFNTLKFTIRLDLENDLFYLLEKNSNLKFGWNGKDVSLMEINK